MICSKKKIQTNKRKKNYSKKKNLINKKIFEFVFFFPLFEQHIYTFLEKKKHFFSFFKKKPSMDHKKKKHFEDGFAPNYSSEFQTHILKRCPSVFLIFYRSKNQNVVIYDANITKNENGKYIFQDPAIDIYWLDIEPSYREKRMKQGINHDREELNMWDKQVYGIEEKRISDTQINFRFKLLPKHWFIVKLSEDTGTVKTFITFQNIRYWVRSLSIQGQFSITHLLQLSFKSAFEKLSLNVVNLETKKSEILEFNEIPE